MGGGIPPIVSRVNISSMIHPSLSINLTVFKLMYLAPGQRAATLMKETVEGTTYIDDGPVGIFTVILLEVIKHTKLL